MCGVDGGGSERKTCRQQWSGRKAGRKVAEEGTDAALFCPSRHAPAVWPEAKGSPSNAACPTLGVAVSVGFQMKAGRKGPSAVCLDLSAFSELTHPGSWPPLGLLLGPCKPFLLKSVLSNSSLWSGKISKSYSFFESVIESYGSQCKGYSEKLCCHPSVRLVQHQPSAILLEIPSVCRSRCASSSLSVHGRWRERSHVPRGEPRNPARTLPCVRCASLLSGPSLISLCL